MRNIIPWGLFLIFCVTMASFTPPVTKAAAKGTVKWYTWEEAIEANKKEKKKLFVDIYTDWCGWCKRMDKATFQNPEVAEYLNKHFYSIKLDAEQKEDILFNGKTFKWVEAGRRGVHTLAYSLLDGKMSYPSVVFLTEKIERVAVSPGYKDAKQFMNELVFTAEEHYKTTSWNDFIGKRRKSK